MPKKPYAKPAIVHQKDIEALTCICEGSGQNTMQDKMFTDPNLAICACPMT